MRSPLYRTRHLPTRRESCRLGSCVFVPRMRVRSCALFSLVTPPFHASEDGFKGADVSCEPVELVLRPECSVGDYPQSLGLQRELIMCIFVNLLFPFCKSITCTSFSAILNALSMDTQMLKRPMNRATPSLPSVRVAGDTLIDRSPRRLRSACFGSSMNGLAAVIYGLPLLDRKYLVGVCVSTQSVSAFANAIANPWLA